MSNLSGIPEKIKLADGTEIIVKDNPSILEAVKAAVEAARKEEKDKLYGTIASLEASKKVLEDEKKQNGQLTATQKAELDKIKEELGAAKAEKEKLEKEVAGKGKEGKDKSDKDDEGKTDGKLSKEEVQALIQEAVKAQQAEADKKIEELRGKLANKTVGDYRKEQLAKYAGELIEDFVPENLTTEEEVNKAIQNALEKSKPYLTKEYEVDGKKQKMTIAEYEAMSKDDSDDKGGKDGKDGKTPTYEGKNPPQKPDQGGGSVDGKELLSRIEEMDDAEYAKHHDQIMREVKSLSYGDN